MFTGYLAATPQIPQRMEKYCQQYALDVALSYHFSADKMLKLVHSSLIACSFISLLCSGRPSSHHMSFALGRRSFMVHTCCHCHQCLRNLGASVSYFCLMTVWLADEYPYRVKLHHNVTICFSDQNADIASTCRTLTNSLIHYEQNIITPG